MTRKRAKKLLMRYTLSRNWAEVVLKKKPGGMTNAEVVNCFRGNYIAMDIERNPCFSCGFNDEDFGCTANPYEPWTVPPTCYLYDPVVVDEMINFYCGSEKNE